MYCSTLWFNSTKTTLTKLKIANSNTHVAYVDYLVYQNITMQSEMFVNLGILSFGELLRKFVFSLKLICSIPKKYSAFCMKTSYFMNK